jgi:fatty-acyl-CoA synthase
MGLIQAVGREYALLSGLVRTVRRLKGLTPDSAITAADVIEQWVGLRPTNPAIFFEDQVYTYMDLDEAANRYARWAIDAGVERGEPVALLMENRPEFIFAWLGIVKAGGVAALINSNLTGKALSHSISISGAEHVIVGAELAESFTAARDKIGTKPTAWITGARVQGTEDLDGELARKSGSPLDPTFRQGMKAEDKCFYIYTSGTTGLPKAANISHLRMLTMMHAFAAATNATETDRMYNVLPLYHSAGGICALGPAFTTGGSIVLRRKFSASEFWDDCHTYKPTLFQYIGELCRYLLNTPKHKFERKHKLRVAIGNGLRPEIWDQFRKRFHIPKIIEFYGATEGNVALMNLDGHTGAVGRVPGYLRRFSQVRLVKFNVEKEEPIRDPSTGFCSECDFDEVGEAIGAIKKDDPRTRFEGYTVGTETEKKILRDVFETGDAWFRTGDLMKRDKSGYYYFIDRVGDTFRWKGENVSTSEVSETLSVFPGIKEANVYGVTVKKMDGRAGMASIVTEGEVDFAALYAHVEKQLPSYARPVFLRIQPSMETTGTFKYRKGDLVREGYDPLVVKDPLYIADHEQKAYVPLTSAVMGRFNKGEFKI